MVQKENNETIIKFNNLAATCNKSKDININDKLKQIIN